MKIQDYQLVLASIILNVYFIFEFILVFTGTIPWRPPFSSVSCSLVLRQHKVCLLQNKVCSFQIFGLAQCDMSSSSGLNFGHLEKTTHTIATFSNLFSLNSLLFNSVAKQQENRMFSLRAHPLLHPKCLCAIVKH